ncbi:ParA family protein, partial [Listeria monocytogenes]|nr:ParA family protein [Listeria monocytogenes]
MNNLTFRFIAAIYIDVPPTISDYS